ncbi:DNA-binding transcriptional regulator, LysR family [Paracoccus pantotrophus]|nr:DNA-binding transcriptional regulator, LysR family [Paracoccus pantotrophus]
MNTEDLRDLNAFVAAAEEGNFTRAAARLGVSQSALSQTIRNLEERTGVRLFNRTTRNVSLTEAGERLLKSVHPALAEIEQGFAQLGSLRDKPAGTIRISADEYAIDSVLWPLLQPFLRKYPDIALELTTDYGRGDIIGQRQDAGVRRGQLVSQDMIAMRIGPDVPMAVVATPERVAAGKAPARPQDLAGQDCINLRLPTHGEIFPWHFTVDGKDMHVTISGRQVFTSIALVRAACLAGFGYAYLPLGYVDAHLRDGRLVEVLADCRKTFEGYHLYYPSRRQQPPALAALIEELRGRA